MIIAVTAFNKPRNELVLKIELEGNMLLEEIKEFWDATTIAERLDALVDTEYVWIGTRIKHSYNGMAISVDMIRGVEDSIRLMQEYLNEELGDNYYECYTEAKKIVCQANEIKGSKLDDDGKVEKSDEYKRAVDATKRIALMIEEITKPKGY